VEYLENISVYKMFGEICEICGKYVEKLEKISTGKIKHWPENTVENCGLF
jgi:formamidopyrimidine-DNA glycosylase